MGTFLEKEGLKGKVDLFCMGQALHWMDIDKALHSINSEMSATSSAAIFAYVCPYLSNGDNWNETIKDSEFRDFKVINGSPNYKFTLEKESSTKINEAYSEFWKKIYGFFRFDRRILDDYYKTIDFEKNMKVEGKIVWNEV